MRPLATATCGDEGRDGTAGAKEADATLILALAFDLSLAFDLVGFDLGLMRVVSPAAAIRARR